MFPDAITMAMLARIPLITPAKIVFDDLRADRFFPSSEFIDLEACFKIS